MTVDGSAYEIEAQLFRGVVLAPLEWKRPTMHRPGRS
jgi:hypothetical protein